MPRDHRFGLDENECFGPVGPDLTNDHPEQAIESIQLGARLLALVHGKLLSKSCGSSKPIAENITGTASLARRYPQRYGR